MPSNTFPSDLASKVTRHTVKEEQIEYGFIDKLQGLKYVYREDIRDRAALEQNFREKFENLNRVNLSKGEFKRLLDEIVTPDVFTAARRLRERSAFTRDDGTPLNYTLVNIKDWCKNTFEVVNQLRINTDYSHHRYDVLILINGVPCVQVELKTLGINPKRAMEQIVDYKNDPGNGYSKTLLCFLQLFIVSNRTSTYYFANNNTRHIAFNADERFLPIYQFADDANTKINHLDDFAEQFLPKCTLGQTISRYMVLVTVRNWLIGHRIVEFEQHGKDRAAYGEKLLPALAQRLAAAGLKRVDARELRRFRLFYSVYPQIRETLSPEWLMSPQAAATVPEQPAPPQPKGEAASPTLIHHLSFSHLAELLDLRPSHECC